MDNKKDAVEELLEIPVVGPSMAAAVIAHRIRMKKIQSLPKGELIVPNQNNRFLSGGIIKAPKGLDVVPINIQVDEDSFDAFKTNLEREMGFSIAITDEMLKGV
jgi:hypothetical protein